jgi:beta-galactosidase/beta-glucuronidase
MGSATQEYPRPDFERPCLNWRSLNGPWQFVFDDNDIGLKENWQKNKLLTAAAPGGDSRREIIVPFVFQTPASGIHDRGVHEVIWYQRFIEDFRTEEEIKNGNRVILRFGAVDYEATVWVSGEYVGFHRGGHVPFDLDITDALEHKNVSSKTPFITVRVFDSAFDLTQPRGKQYWAAEPENIWYTPSSGIWQSVWMESLPRARIADASNGTILRSDDIERGQLVATISTIGRRAGEELYVEITASLGGKRIGEPSRKALTKEHNHVDFRKCLRVAEKQYKSLPKRFLDAVEKRYGCLDDASCWLNRLALWSPEHPNLYDVVIKLIDSSNNVIDEVRTTIGMRSTNWSKGDGIFRLNGQPYFQALVLDQGYWPETGMTPPSPSSLRYDIELAKKMGFNGCRKHQKVEDPIFLYWADRLGFIVWGEMANAYRFSTEYVERFSQEWMEAVKRDINHPCIVTWTPVNESWGYTSLKDDIDQRNHIRSLYYMTK